MSKQTEALKLALEALEYISSHYMSLPKIGCMALAAIEEALAEQPAQQQAYEQANPLGGPAKVFQAMADAIRAGDSYHAVLRQYGYAEAQQQEPWGACVSGRVFVGRLPEHARKLSEDEGVPIQWLYTSPQPAQQPKLSDYEPDGMHHNKPHKCKYPKCDYPCPDLPDCRDAEQPAHQEAAYQYLLDQIRQMTAELAKFRAVSAKALEALESVGSFNPEIWGEVDRTKTAIREALAEQPAQQQEPVAYLTEDGDRVVTAKTYNSAKKDGGAIWSTMRPFCVPSYTSTPAQQQEPFGYFKPEPFGWTDCAETDEGAIALYDRPPASKTWVGLSTDEIYDMYNEPRSDAEMVEFARAIEAKLREKNT